MRCGERISISIHAAREGGDANTSLIMSSGIISIHAAREGGDGKLFGSKVGISISIHAAREGGDAGAACAVKNAGYFNPRRP